MTEFTAVHSSPELKLRDRNTKPSEKESLYLENKLFLVMFLKNILNSASRLFILLAGRVQRAERTVENKARKLLQEESENTGNLISP